ncbi:MAG: PfkB family carbohydrate kinase [Candidatus Solibacter sp.]|nr:PfkB family carbohydrate kinase [Candidatus Solibacter sp.]
MTNSAILDEFPKLRVLVAGDVCLDRWCRYDPALADPSRETGIPRIGVVATVVTPGAAGTIANNLIALGAGEVAVLGMVGTDGFGYELRGALAVRGISHELMVDVPGVPTFTYTKLINAQTEHEDLPRVDFVYTHPLPQAAERELIARLERAAPAYDLILLSDQPETSQGGVVTPAMRDCLARLALARPDKLIWVDSRLRAEHFRHAVVKPNQQEAEAASLRALGRVDYAELRRCMQARCLIVTHGGKGALVVDESGEQWVPAKAVANPVDICGAGDSFSAGAAMTLAVTGDALQATGFGNLVAGITIMKKGTGTASPEEVRAVTYP